MVDLQVELFTAQMAVFFLQYQQNNFVFKDKFGNLRCGRFIEIFHDIAELYEFTALFSECEGKKNEISNEQS